MESKTICRKDLGDEAYILELELILEDMSTQTESMYDAISLSVTALRQIMAEYELPDEGVDTAKEMYKIADMAMTMLNGEPEPDEGVH